MLLPFYVPTDRRCSSTMYNIPLMRKKNEMKEHREHSAGRLPCEIHRRKIFNASGAISPSTTEIRQKEEKKTAETGKKKDVKRKSSLIDV